MVVVMDRHKHLEMLPIEPFRRWLASHVEPFHVCEWNRCDGWRELAEQIGVDVRTIDRWKHQQGYVRLDAVDRTACALGSHIDRIYSNLTVYAPVREARWRCGECDAPLIKPAPLCGFCLSEPRGAEHERPSS